MRAGFDVIAVVSIGNDDMPSFDELILPIISLCLYLFLSVPLSIFISLFVCLLSTGYK